VICSFWHGPFGWLEQLSVRSFLRNGHKVHIYAYEPIEGLPDGAEWRDLDELIPRAQMFYYKGKGTVGVFSDLVRMTLLRHRRGIWADCDMYNVRPIPAPKDYLMAYERPGSVNGAVLFIPHDAPLLDDLLGIFADGERPLLEPHLPLGRRLEVAAKRLLGRKVPAEYMQYGATGPFALTHYVKKHGLLGKVQPSEVFYPIPYEGIPGLMQAGSSINPAITEKTLCVHLWSSQLTRRGRTGMPVPEPDSALAALCAAEGVAISAPSASSSA
jgi:hypothetical protein